MEPIQAVKGMADILPNEIELWRLVEEKAREIFSLFGYKEIRTPLMEKTELFARGIGDATDIVEKEMYTFQDSKGRALSLRPEATASIIRAFIQHQLYTASRERKFFLVGPMFRHERPQKGRYRQFHQIDVEVFGVEDPMLDAELMYMASLFLREIGVTGVELEINSLGCTKCRPQFRSVLRDYLVKFPNELCPDCLRRIEKNPLRCFDCKVAGCKEILKTAPLVTDFACNDCMIHFDGVMKYLRLLEVPYKINPFMVRGLDYYVRTAFEIVADNLGSQNAIGGGGRYDGLMKDLNGPDLPGIGFALGMERIILLLKENPLINILDNDVDIYMVLAGERARRQGFLLAQELRKNGFKVEMDYEGRSLKSQMRAADKSGATLSVIIGDDEIAQSVAQIRFMGKGIQRVVELNELIANLQMFLK